MRRLAATSILRPRAAHGLLALLTGCGSLLPTDERFDDDPAEDCNAAEPADLDTLPLRSIQIGEELGDQSFEPWLDDQQIPMVTGFQGAAMITPWLALPLDAADGDTACWHARFQQLDAEDNPVLNYATGLVFSRVGDHMRTGPIFIIPEQAGPGDTMRMRMTVSDPSFTATHEIEIILTE